MKTYKFGPVDLDVAERAVRVLGARGIAATAYGADPYGYVVKVESAREDVVADVQAEEPRLVLMPE